MNFFGHAVLASWRDEASPFVLGAMLPDFAAMIGARPPGATHGGIAAGIDFHHRTDDAFHRCASFLELSHAAFRWLIERGVGRGSARAVAHVGVEMLLELPLAADARGQRAYLGALDGAGDPGLGPDVAWASAEERARFERLRVTLWTRGAVIPDVAPEVIAQRLGRALAGRPLLALDASAQLGVRDWVAASRAEIARRAAPIVDELKAVLATPPMERAR